MIQLNYFIHIIGIGFIRFQIFSNLKILSTGQETYYVVYFLILEEILCGTISIIILKSMYNDQFAV